MELLDYYFNDGVKMNGRIFDKESNEITDFFGYLL